MKMFVNAVCFLFVLKLKWPKSKNIYDVTYLATAKNFARSVAETVAESRIEFYFRQCLQRFFKRLRRVADVLQRVSQRFAAPANENVPMTSCDHRNETSCMKRCSV